jgi:DNA-binding NtrC family response regulator
LESRCVSFSPLAAKKPPSLDVLIVDDEPLIRWSLSETLAEAGHKVTEVGDRESAIRALTERFEAPDVVLLDYRLPDSNDLGLLTVIRQLSPSTKVILMTAFGTPEVTSGALALGAFRVVGKPFDMHDLGSLVLQAHASRP